MSFAKKVALDEGEVVEKIYRPQSIKQSIFYPIDRRTVLILTDRKVVYRGMFKMFDKNLIYTDISDAFLDGNELHILKKGVPPKDYGGGWPPMSEEGYKPYIHCGWLQNSQEALSLIKSKIESYKVQ